MKRKIAFASILILTISLISCNKKEEKKEMPIMPYKVVEISKSTATINAEYPATLEGVIDIEIRSKVDGYIEKIYIEEGQEVKKGQLLFKLETQTTSQEAAAAKAKVNAAQVEVNRLIPLVERNIISEVQLETAKANLASAKSTYQSILAKINYASITSPINGIVGTLPLRVGSYVSSQTAEPLTRISDISKVYAYFSINEKQQLDIIMNAEGKSFQEKVSKMPEVNLILSNGIQYEQRGKIETFSGQANSQTGSFNVRASFPNSNRLLRSGESGIVQIPTNLKDVILIPQNATLELQDKRIALIVDNENKVKAIPIEVRAVSGGKLFVVDKGLNVNDKLLVEGVGIVQEGTPIKPEVVDFNSVITPETK
ncbi:efflux RND transporter periplasmic adaptor subunit [Flavobacterium capsici]|uniref:Efflux RND transporter periplasmic adaptor subunit n=1 Tax=Flavobacterium capsici TaxID=3075618 RepID=A0AA96JBS9_9FLAO|nr:MULTISPECIES: efflux RND transporter periplasmic adaptor subunit [unclassified Flavobacterium]WNM18899.1 efflux RND transporter periplasmic adaptor subunit [Flavobacterium sp. PMR2A8]WNM22949.1 efflux RND transporter periplasmic adaptor subunit [Flavobacterium sp. PMTSA4]